MKAFDDIGGVHDPADLPVVLEITAEARPILLPGVDNLWIASAPIGGKLIQLTLRQFLGRRAVDALQVLHKGLDVLV